MTSAYLESSALLSWLLDEDSGERVRSQVDGAEHVVTSTLTMVEIGRSLLRREYSGMLPAADGRKVRGLLSRAARGWMTMTVSEEVLRRAAQPFPVEPVRTLDAIHLSTALEWTRIFPDLVVLSLDRRVLENATALGLG